MLLADEGEAVMEGDVNVGNDVCLILRFGECMLIINFAVGFPSRTNEHSTYEPMESNKLVIYYSKGDQEVILIVTRARQLKIWW